MIFSSLHKSMELMNVEVHPRKVRYNFNKRMTTLKRKASQLSTLCDVNVAMICFGPDKTVETWPENKSEVSNIIYRYKYLSHKDKEKYNILEFLEKKKKKSNKKKNIDQEKKRKLGFVYSTWDEKLNQFPEEELIALCGRVDNKLQILRERIELLKQENNKKVVQIHTEDVFSPNNNNPSPLPFRFNNNFSYDQQVFSGSYNDFMGYENLGFHSQYYGNNYIGESYNMNDYFCSGQPMNSQPLYQILPIAKSPPSPLPFLDQRAVRDAISSTPSLIKYLNANDVYV